MGCKPLDKQKIKHKKGLWSPYEDEKLKNYILRHGFGCWSSIPVNAGLQRNGKSCRLRWINYLRPGLKRGAFSIEEEDTVFTFHQILGNKWSQIAQHLPGRTDNEIKNYWHSYLKKRVAKITITETENEAHRKNEYRNELILPSESSLSSLKSTPRNSSVSSFENIKGSPTDTDQSLELEHSTGAQKCNLPKVMFSEWLSFDQFLGQETKNSEFVPCFKNSSFEEALNHSLLLDEDSFGKEMNTNSERIYVEDMLQSEFKFEDPIMENGMIDYFPGEFNMNCDEMYI